MADAFIEEALVSLSTAWNNDTVEVNCPPLTEALHSIATELTALRAEVLSLRSENDALKVNSSQLEHDFSSLRNKNSDLELKIAMITTDTNGFVQRSELLERLSSYRGEMNSTFRLEIDKIFVLLEQFRAQTQELAIDAAKTRENVEHLGNETNAADMKLKQSIVDLDSFVKSKTSELSSQSNAQLRLIQETHNNLTQALQDAESRLADRSQQMSDDANSKIVVFSSDVLEQFKDQNKQLLEFRRKLQNREEAVPSKHDVESLLKAMDEAKKNLEETQFRVSETFSQCMALVDKSVRGASAGRKSTADEGNSAHRILASLNRSSDSTALLGNLPTSVELQLENTRQQLGNILENLIPHLSVELRTFGDELSSVAAAFQRAERLTESLMECFGWGDELQAALIAREKETALGILRQGLQLLLDGDGQIDQKSITTRTVAKAFGKQPSQTSSVPMTIGSGYRCPPLGLDLADSIDGKLGATIIATARNSIAERHGLRPGDRIIKVNGEPCESCSNFVTLLNAEVHRATIQHISSQYPKSNEPSVRLSLSIIPNRSMVTRLVDISLILVKS